MGRLKPDWSELLSEYDTAGPGPLWLTFVDQVVRRVVRRYSPMTYASTPVDRWDDDAILELVQDVCEQRLLSGDQLDYIIEHCRSCDHAAGIIGLQTQQVLAGRARPTQARNVYKRMKALLEQSYESVPIAEGLAFRVPGSAAPVQRLHPTEISAGANVLVALPHMPNRGTQRLSPLFATPHLAAAIDELLTTVTPCLRLEDLQEMCKVALTWLDTRVFPLSEGEDHGHSVDPEQEGESEDVRDIADRANFGAPRPLSPEERTLVTTLAASTLSAASDEDVEVLAATMEGLGQRELAVRLGLTNRQAAARAQRRVSARILEGVLDLDPDVQQAYAAELVRLLELHLLETDDG